MTQSSSDGPRADTAEILVVDDHKEITELLAEALYDEGYTVRVAHDGLSALRAIQARRPSLLILDVAMPHMTGDQLLVRLRADGPAGLPVILMTADRAPERFSALGANQLLSKPFDLGRMVSLVSGLLRQAGGAPARPVLQLVPLA